MVKKQTTSVIPVERIENAILLIRGHKVMLDRDLAELYGVKAIALRQQVSRNKSRFPADFMFRLSPEEAEALVSQNVIPSKGDILLFQDNSYLRGFQLAVEASLRTSMRLNCTIAQVATRSAGPSDPRGPGTPTKTVERETIALSGCRTSYCWPSDREIRKG